MPYNIVKMKEILDIITLFGKFAVLMCRKYLHIETLSHATKQWIAETLPGGEETFTVGEERLTYNVGTTETREGEKFLG